MFNVVVHDRNRNPIRLAEHLVGWQVIPRVGERIATADRVFTVGAVTHDVSTGTIYLTVSW